MADEARPELGGSYIRTPDGTLVREEWTEREAPAAPTKPKKGK